MNTSNFSSILLISHHGCVILSLSIAADKAEAPSTCTYRVCKLRLLASLEQIQWNLLLSVRRCHTTSLISRQKAFLFLPYRNFNQLFSSCVRTKMAQEKKKRADHGLPQLSSDSPFFCLDWLASWFSFCSSQSLKRTRNSYQECWGSEFDNSVMLILNDCWYQSLATSSCPVFSALSSLFLPICLPCLQVINGLVTWTARKRQ